MRGPILAGICAAAMLGATDAGAGDAEAGKALYKKNTCLSCHARNGRGVASFPSIRDRDAAYVADRLETYRARGKVGPNSALMYSHAGRLDDDDIADIAAYVEAAFGAPGKKEPEASAAPETDAPRKVACAQEQGEAMGECTYRVARGGDGAATVTVTVTVTFPNGFGRKLSFEKGAFVRGDATMSGSGTDTEWTLEDGLHRVRVDDQRYDIPDALLAEK